MSQIWAWYCSIVKGLSVPAALRKPREDSDRGMAMARVKLHRRKEEVALAKADTYRLNRQSVETEGYQ